MIKPLLRRFIYMDPAKEVFVLKETEMTDIKQLQYLTACAQTGSFSKAAEILYTTQPTVSKVIKAMEEEHRTVLFERHAKGIELTKEGKRVYYHAQIILENLAKLENRDHKEETETLCVSCNPSSWFADRFVEFYEEHQKDNLHYQVYTADIHEIARRVKERKDDIGFVYVMKDQLASFQYFLSRNYLEFKSLLETHVILYSAAPGATKGDFSGLRLIQRFSDEFSPDNYRDIRDEKGNYASDAEVVVTTNSDYIMERLLKKGDLSNISGAYLTGKDPSKERKICLSDGTENRILFGYICRRGEALPKWAGIFADFLSEKIKNENGMDIHAKTE